MKAFALASILFLALASRAAAAWRVQRYEDAACSHTGYAHPAFRISQATPAEPRNSWWPSLSIGWPFSIGATTFTLKGKF